MSWVAVAAAATTATISGGLKYAGDRKATKNIGKERPLTANEKWLSDQIKGNVRYSPYRDYQGSLMSQMLEQMFGQGAPQLDTNSLFASNQFKGAQMPQMPRLNFEGLPKPWEQNRPQPRPEPPIGGGGGPFGGNPRPKWLDVDGFGGGMARR